MSDDRRCSNIGKAGDNSLLCVPVDWELFAILRPTDGINIKKCDENCSLQHRQMAPSLTACSFLCHSDSVVQTASFQMVGLTDQQQEFGPQRQVITS